MKSKPRKQQVESGESCKRKKGLPTGVDQVEGENWDVSWSETGDGSSASYA